MHLLSEDLSLSLPPPWLGSELIAFTQISGSVLGGLGKLTCLPHPPVGRVWGIWPPKLVQYIVCHVCKCMYVCVCRICVLIVSSFQEWANAVVRRTSSVHLSVCVNFCTNRFFSPTHGLIATKLAHDGLRVSVHSGCAQGQGQRSRDTCTFLHSWNELLRHWRSGFSID